MRKIKRFLFENGLLVVMLASLFLFFGITLILESYNGMTQSILGVGAIAACIKNGVELLRLHQKGIEISLGNYILNYTILGLLPVSLYIINELFRQFRDFSDYWGFLCFFIILHGVLYAKAVEVCLEGQQKDLRI